ncbi:hypothetical protein EZS27_038030 [termite gut metagenome]|uniref:Uncharacterized protein n=1 Tax=termite gut metagenome TaxID=433724 RepID=A0A5J4PML0_9ZZZZ
MPEKDNRILDSLISSIKEDDRIKGTTILDYNEIITNDAKTSKKIDKNKQRTDILLKITYGIGIIIVLGVWEYFVIRFSLIQICCPNSYKVSDAVFITLLTSATANILILPQIVLNYLFPKEK